MQLITLDQFLENQPFFIQEAKSGKTFIYPTDTIYGIGWIYTPEMVNKIFAIKQRDTKRMFSIIAPSFDWISKEYPEANIDELKMYLNNYHGVTYLFDYDQPRIRIIKHPFQTFIENLGETFITTSCNIAGEPPVADTKDIPAELSEKVDYIIDGWILDGRQSVLIDLVENKIINKWTNEKSATKYL